MSSTKIIEANIEVHSRMAATYDTDEPHFRPENREKVRKVLEQVRAKAPGGKLLDMGCGTGFVISLAKGLFDEIHGIDVTQAMLDRVDTSGNVTLHRGACESVPFADASFDVVTAYAFLHHTEDYAKILKEAARVLRPSGLCYVDLEPNKKFWQTMEALPAAGLPPYVAKARASVLETDAQVEKTFAIPQETFRLAEYSKAVLGGIDVRELESRAKELGFSSCEVRLEWFLGQGDVMHGKSFQVAADVEQYLRDIAPVSDHLFKYFRAILRK